ncbi:CubicO group peptidase (beta-lactamase class C family) [Kribbella aluminosa]|uniref:CubicO group peptidase (Beta-lactamase class C family) n=1 Tax=Kribbella aluminosa TaxID=416017 RepID=A0ABS4UGH2_9ACTN|nr:serine hydrolase domain-containing protein [Kribbella aluminosa]MBP2350750.1 CubicO group peptidase (beta-lactamase class C family) [Kribbella aluminosa]
MAQQSSRRTFLRRSGLAVAPAVVAGGAWAYPSAAQQTGRGTAADELDKYLDKLQADDSFSGTVLVLKDGRPVVSRSMGYADQGRRVRNRPDTIFCLASVTKMFTGIAIGRLAQRRSLNLDDPIGKYLSGFKAGIGDKVTIHHLLTHTSGLGDYMQLDGYWAESATWTTPQQTMDGILRYVRTESLAFAPGTEAKYSNSGFHVLGCIVAKVAGVSYYDYIRTNVFRPAGMTSSDFTLLDQWKTDRRFAHPYPTDQSGKRYDALAAGAFGLIGSFVGYGVDSSVLNGGLITGHTGGAPGVSTSAEWYPERGYTAVHLGNYDPAPGANVNQELRQVLTS